MPATISRRSTGKLSTSLQSIDETSVLRLPTDKAEIFRSNNSGKSVSSYLDNARKSVIDKEPWMTSRLLREVKGTAPEWIDESDAENFAASFKLFTTHLKNAPYRMLILGLSRTENMRTEGKKLIRDWKAAEWPWDSKSSEEEAYSELCLEALIEALEQTESKQRR